MKQLVSLLILVLGLSFNLGASDLVELDTEVWAFRFHALKKWADENKIEHKYVEPLCAKNFFSANQIYKIIDDNPLLHLLGEKVFQEQSSFFYPINHGDLWSETLFIVEREDPFAVAVVSQD